MPFVISSKNLLHFFLSSLDVLYAEECRTECSLYFNAPCICDLSTMMFLQKASLHFGMFGKINSRLIIDAY